MVQFRSVLAMIRRWKFDFSLLNHVTLKYRVFFAIQPSPNSLKLFCDRCLVLYRYHTDVIYIIILRIQIHDIFI